MQYKNLSTFKITHENGLAETINAEDAEQAVANVMITESPVVAVLRTAKDVKTLVADDPKVVTFSATTQGGGGSIATPASGTVHVGDIIALKAIAERNYEFECWKMNDVVISDDAELAYTIPELEEGEELIVFTAVFHLANIEWSAVVSPEGAGTAGCLAFPTEGEVEANGSLDLIAIEGTGFTFDHWERNGQSIGTNKILNATVTPLAVGEANCVYTAIFTEN